jgi:hypothetical protein
MRNHSVLVRTGWLVVGTAAALSAPSPGQEPASGKSDSGAERLAEMGRIVRSIRVVRDDNGARRPVEMTAEPLLRWNDPTRGFSDGALWAWGGPGRPLVLTALEHYQVAPDQGFWSLELLSLAPGPVVAEERGSGLRWAPPSSGLELRPVPAAPRPATTDAARLRQAKEIAARFTAHEVNRRQAEQRYDLRLLPRPLHRYADPAAGLVDGAIFLFANGTNPEILLLVEARGEGPPASWTYGLARLSRAAPSVQLDGREVWSQPYAAQTGPDEPYHFTAIGRSGGK